MARAMDRDFRCEALLGALMAQPADRRGRLLQRHPRGAELMRSLESGALVPLSDLIWEELAMREAGLPTASAVSQEGGLRHAVEYWQRRRQLWRWQIWRNVSGDWQTLMKADAAAFESQCAKLGMAMIVGMAWRTDRVELVSQLAPLGRSLGRTVAERLAQLTDAPCDSEVARAWRRAYGRVVEQKKGAST